MLDQPEIVQTNPQLIALIHLEIPKDAIRKEMGPGITELRKALADQGIAATGPWLTHHYKMDLEVWDFDIAIPVEKAVKPVGRVKSGELPGRRVVRTNYRGPYEGLAAAWGEFMGWIEKNGHSPAKDLWECYAEGPESGSDSSKFRTELNRPLA